MLRYFSGLEEVSQTRKWHPEMIDLLGRYTISQKSVFDLSMLL